jgi:hypothetical protein
MDSPTHQIDKGLEIDCSPEERDDEGNLSFSDLKN